MSDEAFVGRVYFERGDGGSPQTYTRVCEIKSATPIGESNELVEKTTFCDRGFRTFISGLSEGQEVTFEANFIVDSAARRNMIEDVKLKRNTNWRIVVDDDNDGTTDLTMWFDSAPISWNFSPNLEDVNAISFTYKISGEIDITEP